MKQILGQVSKDIILNYNVPPKYLNSKIVLYPNDKRHCEKRHLKDFKEPSHFYYVMSNLDYIIQNPSYVYYFQSKNTIEYYCNIGQDISVRIRVDDGKELKVKTIFPVEKEKIEERKQREIEDHYIINRYSDE